MHQDKSKLIVCKASAGSGKTFTLVKEYLKLALSEDNGAFDATRFSHILAITFTNKAANEMKERIMKSLGEIERDGAASDMAEAIVKDYLGIKEVDDSNRAEFNNEMVRVRRDAGLLKKAILHNYSDLSVYTIDSFVQRIVRTFAHDLSLPLNYNVSMDDNELLEMAVDEMYASVGSDEPQLSNFLKDCMVSNMEDGKKYSAVKRDIMDSANVLFKEDAVAQIMRLSKLKLSDFKKIADNYKQLNREFENSVLDCANKALKLIKDNDIEVDQFASGQSGIGCYFQKIASGEILKEATKTVQKFIDTPKVLALKSAAEEDPSLPDRIEGIKGDLIECFNAIENVRTENAVKEYNTRNVILRNLPTMALLNVLRVIVDREAKENEVYHISEFNKLIADVVRDEPAPFIYERVGNKYTNFLIDEFQDTSKQQWLNLIPLVENGIAGNHTSLIVGDGKQAIYRFRNGDVKQFVQLPKVDSEVHGANFVSAMEPLNLKTNYRSCKNIIDFNNKLYPWIVAYLKSIKVDNPNMDAIYADGLQKAKKSGGYVEVDFLESETAAEYNEKMHEAMLAEIENQVALGYDYSKIMILARSNNTLSEIGMFLSERGIPVVSNESFLLNNSRVILMLKSVLHYLHNNSDKQSVMEALTILREMGVVGAKHDFDTEIMQSRIVNLGEILKQDGIEFDVDRLRSMTLYDCCEELVRLLCPRCEDLEIEGENGEPNRAVKVPNDMGFVATFLNKVAGWESRHGQDWVAFLEYLDDGICFDDSPSASKHKQLASQTANDNAVKLMTIHSAKGLEAKVVLYAVTNPKSHSKVMWVDVDNELPVAMVELSRNSKTRLDQKWVDEQLKEAIDDLNVMYVATTRPKEKLFIYCGNETNSENNYALRPVNLLKIFLKSRSSQTEAEASGMVGGSQHEASDQGDAMRAMCEDDKMWKLGDNSRLVEDKKEDKKIEEERNEPIKKSENLQALSYDTWEGRIGIANQAKEIFEPEETEQIKRGLMIHEVLSGVEKCEDVDVAVDRYVKHHDMEEAEVADLRQCVMQVVENEKTHRFFDGDIRVLNERELFCEGKVRRPDRIVFSGDEVWVIDFKTGGHNAMYYSQIRGYCEAIKDMGYEHVKGYLIYVGGDDVELEEIKTDLKI